MKVLCIVAILLLTGAMSCAEPLFEIVRLPNKGLGDIIELKDGTLLLTYNKAREGVFARTSTDQGKTWGEESVLVANPGGGSGPPGGVYWHPSFVRLPNDDILLSYVHITYPATPYYHHNYYRRSADEGQTWSEQFIVTPYPGAVAMFNGKFRLLSTGRILAPCGYKKRWPSTKSHGGWVCLCFYSDDNGYSWQPSKNDVDMDPHEAQEPHVVELKDGRLMMLFRTYSGFMGKAYSTDQGETWSEGEQIRDPLMPRCAPITVDRIPSTGDLLLTMIRGSGNTKGGRTPLTAMISQDEGETWIHRRNIEEDPSEKYNYQTVDFVDDMAILTYGTSQAMTIVRIGIDWFYGD